LAKRCSSIRCQSTGSTAALARIECLADAPRTLAPLLVIRGIDVLEHAFGLQVGKFFVALVPQKKGLPAVADENKSAIRYFQFAHREAPDIDYVFPV
jgi:hypothetical protein